MRILKIFAIAAPFGYMGFIWYLSSRPADAVVNFAVGDSFIKESLHLVEFGILYILFVIFLLAIGRFNRKTSLVFAFIAMFYGLTDEIHQYFVPYRSATVIDFVKDSIGVWVGYWLINRSYFENKGWLGQLLHSIEEKL